VTINQLACTSDWRHMVVAVGWVVHVVGRTVQVVGDIEQHSPFAIENSLSRVGVPGTIRFCSRGTG